MPAALLVAAILSPSGPISSPSEFERALKCRAYAPVMAALLSPQQTEKLRVYWIEKTEKLGRIDGKSAQQVEMSTLVIPIKADDADSVLADCLQAWAADPKSKKPL